MSKQRFKTVSTSALTSKKLAKLDAAVERLFWRIHFASDSYGTMSGDPWDVCMQAVPSVQGYDVDIVTAAIDTLVSVKLLERWQEVEKWWIHVIDHDRHQSGYFRSKRGARHSPIPPSQRKAIAVVGEMMERAGADWSVGETLAPDAEVSATGPAVSSLDVVAVVDEDVVADNPGVRARAHELPPGPRTFSGQIRRAQHDLGSHAAAVINAMVARYNSASDRMLTEHDELKKFWLPACILLADHGPQRLRMALNEAGKANATSMRFAGTMCGRLRDEAAVQQTNPDVGSGDWDHIPTGKGS